MVIVTPDDFDFGGLVFGQHLCHISPRTLLNSSVSQEHAFPQVHVRARLHASRGQGKSCFLVLRQRMATIQCTIFANDTDGGSVSKFMAKYAQQIPKESIVDIVGLAAATESPVQGCTQSDVEIKVSDIHVISR